MPKCIGTEIQQADKYIEGYCQDCSCLNLCTSTFDYQKTSWIPKFMEIFPFMAHAISSVVWQFTKLYPIVLHGWKGMVH